MNIDATFLPVAVELIDNVFATAITFHQHGTSSYDPETGSVTSSETDHAISAGVLSRSRVEGGGPAETYEIDIWVHHDGNTGLDFLPTTEDTFTYDGFLWRVIEVSPTYSSAGLIASKIKGRNS